MAGISTCKGTPVVQKPLMGITFTLYIATHEFGSTTLLRAPFSPLLPPLIADMASGIFLHCTDWAGHRAGYWSSVQPLSHHAPHCPTLLPSSR